jgi:aryl-alcohol dehydrogenase-like predicted oxidoreductase
MASTPSALPLIAASNEAQLDDNLGALEIGLTSQQLETLNAASA